MISLYNNVTAQIEVDAELSLAESLDVACQFGYQNQCRAQFTKDGKTYRCFYDRLTQKYAAECRGVRGWEPVPQDKGRWGSFVGMV